MKSFIESDVINSSTLVWHPTLDAWKYMSFAKPLFGEKKILDLELCKVRLKEECDIQPIVLRQGYLHMLSKRKEKWKMRWVVMQENALQISIVAGAPPKIALKLGGAIVKSETMKEKNDELAFAIIEAGKDTRTVFWSPFQRALIEWINELNKLIHILDPKNKVPSSSRIIEKPRCAENETNLTVKV